MRMKISPIIFVMAFILVLIEPVTANRLEFTGSDKDAFIWHLAEIRIKDSLVKLVRVQTRFPIDSLKPEIYQVVFFSRFNHRQSFTIDLKANSTYSLKVPSHKCYINDKSDISLFDRAQDKDTLRIFFTQHDCVSGAPYSNYASVIKISDTLRITYTKFDFDTKTVSQFTRSLTTEQIIALKEIESGKDEPKRNEGWTSDPTYFFELNYRVKRHGSVSWGSFIGLIENI